MYSSHLDSTVIIFWKRFKGRGFAFVLLLCPSPSLFLPTHLLINLSFIYEYCDLFHGSPYVKLYSPVTSVTVCNH